MCCLSWSCNRKPSVCHFRELAAKRRDALLLYEFSRDAAGLPIPGTHRRFKLTSNPRQIGQESVGLGVYLTTIILYMGIMLLLALLSIYLVVDNSKQAGYTETYTVFVNNVRLVPSALYRIATLLLYSGAHALLGCVDA